MLNKPAFSYLTKLDHIVDFTYGCNGFSAGVNLKDNRLLIDNTIIGTLVACGDSENQLNNGLKGENILSYDAKANQLTMTTHNHYRFNMQGKELPKRTLPTLRDLQRYEWRSITPKVFPKSDVPWLETPWAKFDQGAQLQFDNQQIHYTVGCNQISNRFAMTPKGIKTVGASISTKMNCSDLLQAEDLLRQLMTGDMQLNILKMNEENAVLYQTNANGTEYMWLGKLKQAK